MVRLRRPETPFPRHWLYYLLLKLLVIVVAVVLALYLFGLLEVLQ